MVEKKSALSGAEQDGTDTLSTSKLLEAENVVITFTNSRLTGFPLGKHTYSNIEKISPPKTENFPIKNSDIFHISAQNTDCGYPLELPH